ncbi:DUF2939 domain-containing protein [Chelatococcus reniformis]|uniref:DUF2939 domain-containing protein n=1 Tax=Chelatococcus reniformis TaxID=1494448 RepID=A0A916X7M4_9HYPH|nr:DUF2939 domain-containing protein [Chelatococcus reniformis]GGC46670.1 hypothetical protein GCM10010994_02250 [Chelatococcus reniformis]
MTRAGRLRRTLRSPWLWCGVAAVLLVAYLISPFVAAAKLAKAVKARDVPAVMARVEAGPLRRSLTRQLVRGYIVLNKKEGELGVLGQQMVMAMAVSLFDPIIEQMTTPAQISELLRKGWPLAKGESVPNDAGIGIGGLRDLLRRLDRAGFIGLTEFRLVVDIDGSPERRLGWRLRLDGLKWKLYAVDLPPQLIKRIVDRLPKADKIKI